MDRASCRKACRKEQESSQGYRHILQRECSQCTTLNSSSSLRILLCSAQELEIHNTKKRLSTLDEGARVKIRGPGMAFLGNSEFGGEFSTIHLVKFAEACNSKGYAIKEPNEASSKMNQAINERKPTIVLKEIHTHYVDKKCQGGK